MLNIGLYSKVKETGERLFVASNVNVRVSRIKSLFIVISSGERLEY